MRLALSAECLTAQPHIHSEPPPCMRLARAPFMMVWMPLSAGSCHCECGADDSVWMPRSALNALIAPAECTLWPSVMMSETVCCLPVCASASLTKSGQIFFHSSWLLASRTQ